MEDEFELSDETYQLLEERWEKYKRTPSSAIDLDALKSELSIKYNTEED